MNSPAPAFLAKPAVKAVLFDLDGTFADTAPDMARAINAVRADHGLDALPLAQLRRYVSNGARGMVWAAFGIKPDEENFTALRQEF